VSIATKPLCLKAMGAIRPVNQSIKKRAASSGQGRALFKTYRQNTCSKITKTIKAKAITDMYRPILPAKSLKNCKGLNISIKTFTLT
jgi:hypothetical protein